MALTLKEFRQKYPQYDKVPDQQLVEGLHRKYYSNVPFDEFAAKIEYRAEAAPPPPEPAIETERPWYGLKGEKLTKGLGTQIAEGAKQGLGGVTQAAIDALPNSIDQLPPGVSYEEVDRIGGPRAYYAQVYGITSNEQLKQIKAQATQNIAKRRKESEKKIQEATPEDLTLLETGLRGGAESIARNLPGIAAAVATRNPLPALASAGVQTGAESYGEARAEGLTPGEAARYAGVDATIEIATELLPTKWLLDTFGAKSLNGVRKKVLKFAAGELGGEQLATFGQSVNAYLNDLDEELAQAETLGEKAEIQARRQAVTAIATLATSGAFAGGMSATAKLTEIARKRRAREEEIPVEEAAPEVSPEVPPEEIAPVRRPRPAVPAELGAALEGLETTELPPEVIEGVPPAVVDSAKDILSLVDEGKAINLFRARSLARQLGADIPQNANKETTLTALREAVALVAAPPAAVEPAPAMAPPVEAGEEIAVPEAAQVAPIETTTPPVEVPSEPTRAGAIETVAGAGARGIELPVSRVGAAGPEVTTAPPAGLERPSGAAPRVDEGKEAPPAALEPETSKPTAVKIPKALHGSPVKGLTSLSPHKAMEVRGTTWFTDNPDIADQYIYPREYGEILYDEEPGQVYSAELTMNNPLVVDYEGKVGDATSLSKLVEKAKTAGHDGLIVKNVDDSIDSSGVLGTSYAVFKPDQINLTAQTPTAPPSTQIFESIESLNRPLPPVTEQLARDRAPSLRRELGKAVKQFDTGEMSGAELANRASMLLLQTQKQQVVQPRVRGAEFIRERLFNASRNGYLDPQGVEIASWFVQQNPLLVQDLGVSVQQQPEKMAGSAAFYNPVNRIITLFKDKGDEQTATHEILHHTERLMPAEIRAGILKAYVKQLTKAIKSSKSPDEKIALQRLLEHHLSGADSLIYDSVIRAFKSGILSPDKYQFVNPSEFWAVNGSRIVQGRYNLPPGVVGQIRKWLREFIQKAKDVFGLKSDAAIIRALDSLAKADGKYQTEQLLAQAPAYRAIQPPKNLLQVRKAGAEAKRPSLIQKAAQQFEGHNFYKNLVRKFADTTEPIMALDRAKKRAGFLITLGPDRNDIASELVRSPNIADFIIRRRVEPAERRLQEFIKDYARVTGVKPEDAVDKLDSILIAIHEPVRRETKYLRNVGLRNDIRLPSANLPFAAGQPAMTPADYREYLEGLRSKLPPDQAAQIQDVMRVVVDKFKTSRGFSPKAIPGKPTPLDINDKFYDVIPRKIDGKDAYTPQLLRAELDEYRSLTGEQKAAVDAVRSGLAEINELERQLGREANYWPPQVDSVIASYQWGDTYVPFQGIPDADDSLDFNSKKLSGELTETAQAWDGRSTDFDSPILQSIDNAKRAAGRVSRKDLVGITLVNNIKQGFLRAKSIDPEVYTFDDRRAPDFDFSVLQGKEKVLDYQPDGDIHVYELKEGDKIDALKRAYRDLNPWLKPINTLTSWFAQYHTRFNPAFAPMDFFTNTMSNLGLITAGEGGVKEGGRYIAQTLSNVARSGLFAKTANLSRVLSSKDPAALDKLLRSGDSFYRDAVDFISRGGLSLQRQALGIDIQREELVNAVGPGLIIKTKDQVFRLFDIYNDMFELTSRLAAYTAHLKDITARAKLKGIDVNDPEVQEALKREATTFALELMNFRKMGEYGRILSALYQFFKPGATSAKLAYEAVRKAVISAESELKNTDPAVWARLNSIYELQELEEEQAKPRPDQQKITELQNAIQANDAAKQKFITNYNMEKKNAAIAIPLFFVTGGLYYAIAQMFSPDDDEGRNKIATDEMSRWTRYARMPMPGQEEFFQLPWGYGIGAFAAAGAQTEALRQGNLSFSDYAGNMIEIGLDSFMPFPASRTNPFDNVGAWILGTISPSAARGFIEYTLNLDSLGNPIYNSRLGKYADAYSGTARAGELHNAMADVLFGISEGDINWNPNTIAFAMNTYADGPNVIAESAFNIALRLRGEKDADLKKDIPFIKRFVGRMSNFDAREFSEAERWIRKEAPKYKTFRDIRPPEEYDRYVEKHPSVPIISAMYDNVLNGTLSTLSEQRKLILRNRELTPKERQESLDDIDYDINAVKRNFVESYRAIREEEEAGS